MGIALRSNGALAFEYYQNDDGDNTITLTRCVSRLSKGTVVIPATYQGFTVTRIGKDFFDVPSDKLLNITSVVLPDTVWHLDEEAFLMCGLTSVTIPATLTSISHSAFSHNPVKVFEVSPDNPRYAASEDGKLLVDKVDHVLKSCGMSPGKVKVPEGVETIEVSAFECVTAESIEFPSTLKELQAGAFLDFQVEELDFSKTRLEYVDSFGIACANTLKRLRFPATLRNLAPWALAGSPKLNEVHFLGGVPDFVEGEMTDRAGKLCPDLKSIQPYGNIYTNLIQDDGKIYNGDGWEFYMYRATPLKTVTTYVPSGMGWDDIVASGTWMNCPIRYVGEKPVGDSYGPFVPGERVEIQIPGLAGYAAKGLPAGLKLDGKTGTVSGSPTKPTGDAGVTVTFARKGSPTLTARFVVGPVPTVSVALAGDAERCAVSGAGKAYLAGKRVTLAAKAPRGTAFAGWTRDGAPWPDEAESRNPKLAFAMPSEGLALVATFERERMSLACPGLAGGTFTVGVAGGGGGIPLEIATQSGVRSVKASRLPPGMRLAKDRKTGAWSIVGSPRKAGSYGVTLTATAVSGATETVAVPVEVAPLPSWACGTFGGVAGRFAGPGDDDFSPCGTVSLKVAATGRLTAKVQAGGKSYALSADGFAGCDAARETFRFEMATRAGDVYVGEIARGSHDVAALMRGEGADAEGAFAPAGREPYPAFVWRNEHGRDGRLAADGTGRARKAMDAVKALKRVELARFDPAWGTVAVTVDAKGNVKASGKTADGANVRASGFLALDDAWEDGCHVIGDIVFCDRKTKRVYAGAVCWEVRFDAAGDVAGLDETCCDKSLKAYPFE